MWTEKRRYWAARLAMVILGIIFITAGLSKLIMGQAIFTLPFVPGALNQAIYIILPYIEILVGCLLILGMALKFTVTLSALLITGFVAFNILWMTQGAENCAGCFGSWITLVPGVSLALDSLMVGLVAIIICYREALNFSYKGRECEYV